MRRSYIGIGTVLFLLLIFNPVFAQFERTAMLIDTPTADVIAKRSLSISGSLTGPLDDSAWIDFWEGNLGIRYGVTDRLEVDFTAFTAEDFVLGFNYQLRKVEKDEWGLSVGMHEIGLEKHISALGHGEDYHKTAWSDDDFIGNDGEVGEIIKPPEAFSAFVVATLPLLELVETLPPLLEGTRFHMGIGRGRYVGYDGPNEYLNSDIFFDDYHPDWAIGLFGGLEINLGSFSNFPLRNNTFVAEYDSRDANIGFKTDIGPVSAAIVLHKIEGFGAGGEKFQRIGFGLGYTTAFPKTKHEPVVAPVEPMPIEPVVAPPPVVPEPEPTPEPEPEPEPIIIPPIPETIDFGPIYFDFDMSNIRSDQRGRLADNANVLDSHPDWRVLIEGHCDERGTNEYNIALGQRRADSTRRYLINYGIAPSRLSTVSYGEERPDDLGHDEEAWDKNRRAEFDIQE